MADKAKFTIIRKDYLLALETEIQNFINKGYIPIGNIVIQDDSNSMSRKRFYQSMYKPLKE